MEESLWFRKGQEVEELVSISLDPDITIQEDDQYVTIRGSLLLTGEYKNFENTEVSEEENVASQKYVERVEVPQEGDCEFSHRFPVDITIPNNRIQSIYDIDVLVESFDYSLPERSCLKLTAELTISGLYDSSQQETVEEDQGFEVLQRYEAENPAEQDDEVVIPIQFQENQYDAPTYAEEQNEQLEVLHRNHGFDDEDDYLFESEARKQQEGEQEEAFPKFPTLSYQAMEETKEEEYQQSSTWNAHGRSEGAPTYVEEVVEEVVEEAPVLEEAAQEMEESSSSPEKPSKLAKLKTAVKNTKQKTMTLTEFFARKEENADQARLKMCIVQKNDTLDSLADRYDVSVPNLLRVNNLELNQDVHEGQVLYIPVALAKK
ncbi:stage VI sporulation protein D [Bacillus sp. MRMR6]|uniref:stage VI sporulation protein D n=1 Tax=Bacillus sp. MRMR6 TaxID=1928617 RepID=UPI0026DD7E26|nr:stage VI sporulation protein D [Bacillus sp. MRMR6]